MPAATKRKLGGGKLPNLCSKGEPSNRAMQISLPVESLAEAEILAKCQCGN